MSGSETPPVSDQETACDKVRTLETTDEVTEAAPASQLPPTQVSLDTPEDPHTVLLPPPTETVSDVDDAVVSQGNSDTPPIRYCHVQVASDALLSGMQITKCVEVVTRSISLLK